MQPTTSPLQVTAQIGKTDRPIATPLTRAIAKGLSALAPIAQTPEPVAAPTPSEKPAARPDGRNLRLGSFVDIRV